LRQARPRRGTTLRDLRRQGSGDAAAPGRTSAGGRLRPGLLRLSRGLRPVLADLAQRVARPLRAGVLRLAHRRGHRPAPTLVPGDLPLLQEPAAHAAREPLGGDRLANPSPAPAPGAGADGARVGTRPAQRRRSGRAGAGLEPGPAGPDLGPEKGGPAPPPAGQRPRPSAPDHAPGAPFLLLLPLDRPQP